MNQALKVLGDFQERIYRLEEQTAVLPYDGMLLGGNFYSGNHLKGETGPQGLKGETGLQGLKGETQDLANVKEVLRNLRAEISTLNQQNKTLENQLASFRKITFPNSTNPSPAPQ